jgi:ribosomal protein L11 methyltransferase
MLELQLLLPPEGLDAWCDALLEAGAASVAIEDEDGDTEDEVAVYGEPGLDPGPAGWRNNRVGVLLGDGVDAATVVAAAAAALGRPAPQIVRSRVVEDRDWVAQTQSQFGPIAIGRIWIVPSWHEPPDPAAISVRIDPGVAFGTGTHPTTRLCLRWIERHLAPGASVLDYGCGSGILSICAALLGAAVVVGVDIDPQALATAADNARRNGARARYTTPEHLGAAADAAGAGGDAGGHAHRFDLVVANILANPLVLLAPSLAGRVGRGGSILLSGVLERQAADVIEAYRRTEPAIALRVWDREEGWVALLGTRAD